MPRAGALETLDGDVLAEAGDDDLAVLRLLRLLHGEEVAVHDAGVLHAHAAHLEQVVGAAREHAGFHEKGAVDVLLGQDRAAGGDAADERQRELRQARQGQAELLAARLVERAQGVGLQTDAARRAADQLDHALARQRLQMLLGGVGRLEAELVGDLGARGRRAGALDRALDEIEDLLLAVGELRRFLHDTPFSATTGGRQPG